MRKSAALSIFLILVFCLASCSAPPTPKEFKSEAGGFTVMTPVEMQESTQDVETQSGKLTLYLFMGQLDATGYYITYSDYPPEIVHPDRLENMLDGSRDGAVANFNGKLVSETRITLAGHPGRELVITGRPPSGGPGSTLKGRMFMVKNRLYQVMVMAPKGQAGAKEADAFLQSFKLLGQ
jgi:hypothetical protein